MSYREKTIASSVDYIPSILADWDGSLDPGDLDDAVDQLADRVKNIEGMSTSVFGNTFSEASSLGLSSITGTLNFQQKLRLSFTSVAGTYIIFGKFSWRHSSTNNDFKARIQTNDLTNGFDFQLEPKDVVANQLASVCTFYIATFSAGGQNIDLDYATSNTGSTAYIQNARLASWRVS